MQTLSAKLFTTARSSRPSPLKSETRLPIGRESVCNSVFGVNDPFELFTSTATAELPPNPKNVGMARSGRESALKLPTPTEPGPTRVEYEVVTPNVPSPEP